MTRRPRTYAAVALDEQPARFTPNAERAFCGTCWTSRRFTEGKCDHCAAPLAPVRELPYPLSPLASRRVLDTLAADTAAHGRSILS